MIVAVGLFSVVMLISVGALMSLVTANRKAQALQSVMNNLNVAVDGMVRAVRIGTTYHCGEGTYTQTADCSTGDTTFAFEPYHSSGSSTPPPWIYWYQVDTINGKSVGRIYKSEDGTKASGIPITAPEVSIDSAKFYVLGSCSAHATACTPDELQPKVLIVLEGTAGAGNVRTSTTFHIQATAVQRILDL
jgi:hypothetical protein